MRPAREQWETAENHYEKNGWNIFSQLHQIRISICRMDDSLNALCCVPFGFCMQSRHANRHVYGIKLMAKCYHRMMLIKSVTTDKNDSNKTLCSLRSYILYRLEKFYYAPSECVLCCVGRRKLTVAVLSVRQASTSTPKSKGWNIFLISNCGAY